MSEELWLVIRRESVLERIHHVVADTTLMGRHESHPICLVDGAVSRNHAVIRKTPKGFLLEDLGSKNGTLVNGRLIQRQLLSPLMEIQIGPYRLLALSNPKDADENAGIPDDETKTSPGATLQVAMIQMRLDHLTPAQRRVYDCLMEGASEKQAATGLHLSIHTVHSHIKVIYKVFSVTTRAELLAFCAPPTDVHEML